MRTPEHSRLVVGAVVVLALGIYDWCEATVATDPAGECTAVGLAVEYSGCVLSWSGSETRCIFEPGHPLYVWVPGAYAGARLVLDGLPCEVESRSVHGEDGHQLVVHPDEPSRQVSLIVDGQHRWSLPIIASSRVSPDSEARGRELDQAMAAIGREINSIDSEYVQREVLADAGALVTTMLEEGYISRAVDLVAAIAHELSATHGSPGVAAQWLNAHWGLLKRHDSQAPVKLQPSVGAIEWERGRVENAARAYRESIAFGFRTHDVLVQLESTSMYSALLAELGYMHESASWSQRSLELDMELSACELSASLRNAGWLQLEALRQGAAIWDPSSMFVEALAWSEQDEQCRHLAAGANLDLAELDLWQERPLAATARLENLESEHLSPAERAQLDDLRLRVMLREEHSEFEFDEALEHLRISTAGLPYPQAHWRLATRRGDLEMVRGNPIAARTEYARAEALLDEIMVRSASGVTRRVVAERHRASAEGLVEALLELRRPAEAMGAARRARARPLWHWVREERLEPQRRVRLAGLRAEYQAIRAQYEELIGRARRAPLVEADAMQAEVRQREEQLAGLSLELDRISTTRDIAESPELRGPEPGELIILLAPLRGRWVVMAQDDSGVTAQRIELDLSESRQSQLVLEPLTERIDRARSVRFIAAGPAMQLAVHMLPWRGRPLVMSKVVAYGMDVYSQPASDKNGPLLLVSDPTESLPDAREAGRAISAMLRAQGRPTIELNGRTASWTNVRAELGRSAVFHYSGHARGADVDAVLPPRLPGGPRLSPHLLLAGNARLEPYDVLTLASVPQAVILMACATGHEGISERSPSPSLALAFLMAGSRSVIATSSRVADDVAAQIEATLYEGLDTGKFDAAVRLHRAMVTLLARDRGRLGSSELGKYRAWVQ